MAVNQRLKIRELTIDDTQKKKKLTKAIPQTNTGS